MYADWLEEHGDLRHEVVRLQVRLAELAPDDPDRPAVAARVAELRPLCPAYWLARLDPPVWCAAGNIIGDRLPQPGQPPRRGTKLLSGGAKVYLAARTHPAAVLAETPDRFARLFIVGRHRVSHTWIGCVVSPRLTENWRVELVRHPGAKVRLAEAHWEGFALAPRAFTPPEGRAEALLALFDAIQAAHPQA